MNSDTGNEYSLSGFTDYTATMETGSSGVWQVLGYLILLGTVLSLVPQIYNLIKQRSSYGLNPLTMFITNFSQLILVFNIVCLRTSDFIAIQQASFFSVLPRLMTFLNAFSLWLGYMPIIFLNTIFFDKEIRSLRPEEKLGTEWFLNKLFILLNVCGSVVILIIYSVLLMVTGVGSDELTQMGKVFGTMCIVIVFIQYTPQFITTCKLQDNGSLSLLLLCIQAPGGTASALFMAIGQGDHWSTWMSTLAASVQQFILITMIVFFKIKRRRIRRFKDPLIDQSEATPNLVDPALFEKNDLD